MFFAHLLKNQRKSRKLRKISLNIFAFSRKLKEDFLALLIIKENENLCFSFDHKKISFLHVY